MNDINIFHSKMLSEIEFSVPGWSGDPLWLRMPDQQLFIR